MAAKSFPVRGRHTGEDYYFKGSGTAAFDTVSWGKLIDVITLRNRPATITIADRSQPVVLDSAVSGFANGKQMHTPVIIRGETKHARIKVENGFQINWGGFSNHFIPLQTPDPAYYARGVCNPIAAKAWEVVVDDAAWVQALYGGTGPLPGDMVAISSLDTIPGSDPHLVGGQNCPGEVHKIAAVTSSTNLGLPRLTIRLMTRVEDAMTTSPTICFIKAMKNCGIERLTFETSFPGTGGASNTTFLQARRCDGFFIDDIFAEKMPGTTVIFSCVDVRAYAITCAAVPDPLADYGLVVGGTNGFWISDCVWYHTRHAFTTGGQTLTTSGYTSAGTWSPGTAYVANQWVSYTPSGASSPSKYVCLQSNTGNQPDISPTQWFQLERVWGTPMNGLIRNCRAYMPGNAASSWVGFDTHASGVGIDFAGCEAISTINGHNSYGYASRSRSTRFIECKARGPSSQWMIGFQLRGADCEVDSCYVDTCNEGVRLDAGAHGGIYHGRRIHNTRFDNCFGPAVISNVAVNNVHVTDNRTSSVAGGSPRSGVVLNGGTGHRIRGNHFDKQTSGGMLNSVDFKTCATTDVSVTGNHVTGYGTGVAGFLSNTGAGAAFESAYAAKNFTS